MSEKKKPSGLSKFLSYYLPYKGLLLADLLCAALAAAFALILPACVRHITTNVLASGADDVLAQVFRTGAVMVAIIVAKTGCSFFYDYKGHDMGAKIERDMRLELFAHYQKLSLGFFDEQKTGQLMSRLTNDLINLAELYHHAPENLVVYGTQFVGSLLILLLINWKLTLVICAVLPIMALFSAIFYRKMEDAYRISRERIADVNTQAEESLSGVRVVKSFAAEALETQKFSRENERFYKSRSSIYRNEAVHYGGVENFFTPLITVAIVVAGGLSIARGALAPSDLLVFIMYAAYLTGPVPKLAFMVQQYQDGMAGYRRFREIVDLEPAIRDAENAVELPIVKGRVTFRDVTFRYNENREYVLKNINLDVRPGETVAIAGHSGVGKTTLCALIPRLYEACEGEICIDGVRIKDVTLQSLRRNIGIVGQETFLFAGTVIENILYGNPGATAADAVEAAKKANAHSFISALHDGYDTDIGQRGVKLSGGQRQRISIARVFLKNPPILILDEATSALDYESERAVMECLDTFAKDRTTFIIAHRLSTIQNADRIVVLSDDGIAEQGTHGDLLSRGGAYAKLYNA